MATKKNVESTKELVLEQEAVKDSKKVSAKKVSTKKPAEKALKVTKKVTKKAEEQVEEKKSTEVAKAPEKTVAKKTAVKKTVTKKATAKKEESPTDKFFPKELEVDGTKFSRVQMKSWEEFKEFVNTCQSEGSLHVVIACNWPKKYKKIYDENNQGEKLFPKDGFEHDLDLQEVLMLQQTRETAITISILTESVILFREDYFELTDFGYFMTNGMPFMVYAYEEAK